MAQYMVEINDKVRAIVEADEYDIRDRVPSKAEICVRVIELIVRKEDLSWI